MRFKQILIITTIILIGLLALSGTAAAQVGFLYFFPMLICAIYAIVFIVIIILAIWVYRDAESRGMSGVLWLIVVLVGSLIGLIVYLVIRRDYPKLPPGYHPPPTYYPPPPGYYNYPPLYHQEPTKPSYIRDAKTHEERPRKKRY